MSNGEWLEGDNPFAEFDARKTPTDDSKKELLVLASKHKAVFESGIGKDLLDHWTLLVRRQKIPVNASQGELAYWNGVREFVEGIHAHIEYANNGGQPAYRQR